MIVNLPGLKENSYLRLDEDLVLQEHVATDIYRFVLEDLLSDNQFSSRDDPDRSVKLEALADNIATDRTFLSYGRLSSFKNYVQRHSSILERSKTLFQNVLQTSTASITNPLRRFATTAKSL